MEGDQARPARDLQEERREVRVADIGPGVARAGGPSRSRGARASGRSRRGRRRWRGDRDRRRGDGRRRGARRRSPANRPWRGDLREIVGEHRLEAEPPESLRRRRSSRSGSTGPGEGRDPHPVAGTGGRGKLSRGDQNAGDLRKPSSVSRRRSAGELSFLWDRRCRRPRATYPEAAPRPGEPDARAGRAARVPLPYLVLLRMGFAVPPPSPAERCALTAPFHPYRPPRRRPAVYSLLHFPSRRRASPLASMLPVGARTFLSGRPESPRSDSLELSGADRDHRPESTNPITRF